MYKPWKSDIRDSDRKEIWIEQTNFPGSHSLNLMLIPTVYKELLYKVECWWSVEVPCTFK